MKRIPFVFMLICVIVLTIIISIVGSIAGVSVEGIQTLTVAFLVIWWLLSVSGIAGGDYIKEDLKIKMGSE